ncbi:alpha/beta fold hydrolase [Salinarimonas sp.]|uniref:alpha/beta fold hydrolase n=1 Tax=Salinarimonas sp. TaxID=2766526 RepID=UPI003918F314
MITTPTPPPAPFRSLFVRAGDGLRLHARVYGQAPDAHPPVVCLPGLTRNAHDFHDLALALSTLEGRPRRVIALDYRGRGLSAHDPDWRRYSIEVESGDVLAVLAAAGVAEAIFVGTSRGGLITMALAATRPTLIAGAVLVDVGPVVQAKGLIRIRSALAKMPRPKGWEEAIEALRRLNDAQFPALDEAGWRKLAEGIFREPGEGDKGSGLVPTYDPALVKTLEVLDLEQEPPALWPLFEALAHVPVLVVRGALSDVLSRETLTAMLARHPRIAAHEVPGQGHAPLLDGETAARIVAFIDAAEAGDDRDPSAPPAAAEAAGEIRGEARREAPAQTPPQTPQEPRLPKAGSHPGFPPRPA